MIRVRFHTAKDTILGFTLDGHAGAGVRGEDIVCAAVSSAAYMAANTVIEIIGATANVTIRDGYMQVMLTDKIADCQDILSGFQLHLEALQDQYPKRVHLMNTEV